MIAYRIASRRHPVFDGKGAAEYGGRWNSPRRPVIYASATLALAMLEQLAHTQTGRLPRSQVFIEITIPSSVSVETVVPKDVPAWDTEDLQASRAFGDRWLSEGRTCVLLTPSVIVPREQNVVINAVHPGFSEIVASAPQPVVWDRRLGRAQK